MGRGKNPQQIPRASSGSTLAACVRAGPDASCQRLDWGKRVKPGLKRFIQSWLINTLAVLVTVLILRGHIRYENTVDLFVAALLLGILNAFFRPIMMYLALPLLLLSLGLFMIVINACLLFLVHWMMGTHFEVDGFGWAMLGSLIISVISLPLNILTGLGNARVTFHRQRRPPGDRGPSGGGPVIDV
ncbi:MAG: phage holin family protein [Verrucomicrobiota bacterium]